MAPTSDPYSAAATVLQLRAEGDRLEVRARELRRALAEVHEQIRELSRVLQLDIVPGAR
ncbi:hypothetical protein [Streptomyces sp. ADI93-02]|uniref:hypothetical protein n=1 Tax=Streptomyces sp. ADI93-02 TaxID=1522757 RepID=UPI000F9DBC38|nr:hypothetical protein [Streptomyces sp. ADI93-02]RPK32215.1 hypothetical protein EES40_36625 [Streptomyces sp. ADI93-02]